MTDRRKVSNPARSVPVSGGVFDFGGGGDLSGEAARNRALVVLVETSKHLEFQRGGLRGLKRLPKVAKRKRFENHQVGRVDQLQMFGHVDFHECPGTDAKKRFNAGRIEMPAGFALDDS